MLIQGQANWLPSMIVYTFMNSSVDLFTSFEMDSQYGHLYSLKREGQL